MELSFIGTVLQLNRISACVKMVLLKVFSFNSTFTGCCFFTLAHGRDYPTAVFVLPEL